MNSRGFALASVLAVLSIISLAIGGGAQSARLQLSLLADHRDYWRALSACLHRGETLAGQVQTAPVQGEITDALGVAISHSIRRLGSGAAREIRLDCSIGRSRTTVHVSIDAAGGVHSYAR
ncbi:MAG: hypothetical protein ISN29_11980 [Gammaproteobacteria bacterium AqS3]|nr:hypothetical protein [Gammaproteobacteria bacterium AqS3]